jgi:hypothetical protein
MAHTNSKSSWGVKATEVEVVAAVAAVAVVAAVAAGDLAALVLPLVIPLVLPQLLSTSWVGGDDLFGEDDMVECNDECN